MHTKYHWYHTRYGSGSSSTYVFLKLTVQLVKDAARHVLQTADPSTGGAFKRRRVLFRLKGNFLHQIARSKVQVVASRTRPASSNIRASKATLAGVSVRVPSEPIVVIV